MTKAYHRRWHAGHGRFAAAMHRTGGPHAERRRPGREPDPELFGSPAYRYRQAFVSAWRWLGAAVGRREDEAFRHEATLRHALSEIRAAAAARPAAADRSWVSEVAAFLRGMLRRKLHPWELVRSPQATQR